MSWQALVLLSTFFLAFSMIFLRLIGRSREYSKAGFVVNAGAFVFLWLTGLALLPQLGHVDSQVLSDYFWRFVGGGILFALTNVATYKSMTYVDAATGTIFNTLNALFGVIGAALTLNENLSAWQAIGGALLLLAVVYSTLALRSKKAKLSRRNLFYGLGFALIAGVLYGAAITNEKWLLEQMSSGSYVVYGWGWQCLASVGVAVLLQFRKMKLLKDIRLLKLVAPLGIVKGVAGAAFVLSEIRSNNVALVTAISNFKIIIVVVLGVWLLKERQKLWQKTVGAVAALAGLTVMFWR
jgi:drug/metabolite transporter (DMT)-like permease